MKINTSYGKRAIALALAATMLFGDATMVSAAKNTDVTKAADGSVSKVIGIVETGITGSNLGTDYYYNGRKGEIYPIYKVNSSPVSMVTVAGNTIWTLDANGNRTYGSSRQQGHYEYKGLKFAKADYSETTDITTYQHPMGAILEGDISKYRDPNSGLYSVDGQLVKLGKSEYHTTYYLKSDNKMFADGNLVYKIEAGNKVDLKDQATGLYLYNGEYYLDAKYYANNLDNNTYSYYDYTKLYNKVAFVESKNDLMMDSDGNGTKDKPAFSKTGTTADGRFYYVVGTECAYSYDLSKVEMDENGIYIIKQDEDGFYKQGEAFYKTANIEFINSKPAYIKYTSPINKVYDTYNSYTNRVGQKSVRYSKDGSVHLVDGYYRTLSSMSYYVYYVNPSVSYTYVGSYATVKEFNDALNSLTRNVDGTQYVEGEEGPDCYYEVNGNKYSTYSSDFYNNKYVLCFSSERQIEFGNKKCPTFSWNSLTNNETKLQEDGKKVQIGYEVMVDDELITETNTGLASTELMPIHNGDSTMMIATGNSIKLTKKLGEGDSVKLQVRGIYYVSDVENVAATASKDKYQRTSYRLVKTGEWSDPYVYTRSTSSVGKINDLNVAIDETTVKLTWTPITDANSATVYQIDSTVPLNINDENVKSFINGKENVNYYTVNSFSIYPRESIMKLGLDMFSGSFFDQESKKTIAGSTYAIYGYHYYVARMESAAGNRTVDKSYSNIASIQYKLEPQIPTVENLRVEYNQNGGFYIAWDKKNVDAKVVVYAYEKPEFPKYFNYIELNAMSAVTTSAKKYDTMGERTELTEEVFDKLVSGSYCYITGDGKEFYSQYDSRYGAIHDYRYSTAYKKDDKFYTDSACKNEIAKKYVAVIPGTYSLTDNRRVEIIWDANKGKNYVVDRSKLGTVETVEDTKDAVLMSSYLSTYCNNEYNIVNNKVYKATASLGDGKVFGGNFTCENGNYLESNKKYYFVAYTYDGLNYDTAKAPVATIDGKDFVYYNDFSAASNQASATTNMNSFYVATKVTKNSIKLTMSGDYTGYIIYRKSGKGKYKKLATITDNFYVDKKVKLGKEYTYKVYNYNYNPDTNTKKVSKITRVVKATPSNYSNFTVKAQMKSKTAVKLSWTKLSKAKKYEIYRISSNGDYNSLNNDNEGNALPGNEWKLIKTIKKAKTTSYVDKVKDGESYSYAVVAYYKDKKKLCRIASYDSISMTISTPEPKATVKGTSAKITWEPDKYAKGFEVSYYICDKYGSYLSNIANVATTAKTSYTVKGIPEGGSIVYKVRAYTKTSVYSSWSSEKISYKSLDTAKSIKASYDASKKAVKITWKPVKGAKYYKVYRSTKASLYDAASKKYAIYHSFNIAAEANDNEFESEVSYREYNDISGTIVGTAAYDYYLGENDVKYYYTVVAFGENSNEFSCFEDTNGYIQYASSKPATVVYNPTKLSITKVSKTKKGARISFAKVAKAQRFVLLRATKKNGKYTVVAKAKGKATSIVDKTAKKGKTYFYKLRVVKTNELLGDTTITSAAKKCKIK